MMLALLFYPDDEIRSTDLDPKREDVLRATLDTDDVAILPLGENACLLYDANAIRLERRLNVHATIVLLAATGFTASVGVRGVAALLGRTPDDEFDDVPDGLAAIFEHLTEDES